MRNFNIARSLVIFGILILNIGCDQISKRMVRDRLRDHEEISLIKDYFKLTKVENTGAFLSLGNELPNPVRFILLTLLPLAILGFGLGYIFVHANMPQYTRLGFAFVIGGGIGNIYDRLVHGSVTDFLHIDFGFFQTGIFNLADVSILAGVGVVLVDSLTRKVPFQAES